MKWLLSRPTGDLLTLLIAFTICFCVLAAGATVALVELIHPESDTNQVIGLISDVINTLIGLLAGVLIGRTDAAMLRADVERLRRETAGPADQ